MLIKLRGYGAKWDLVIILLSAMLMGLAPKVSAQTLTNADVAKMVKAKLGDSVIISTIKNSACKFDISPDALIKLKEAGVSDKVLEAMTEAGHTKRAESAFRATPESNDTTPLPENYGIYALYKGKLYSLSGGDPAQKPRAQTIELFSFETGSPKHYTAAALGPDTLFIVFEQGAGDFAQSLSLYRLPFGRNLEVTNPDAAVINMLGPKKVGPKFSPINKILAARLQAMQVPLMAKPVPNQPQMVEVKPSAPLADGDYALVMTRGQALNFVWLAVGTGQYGEGSDCVDIAFAAAGFGGFGVMHDYWMMHGPASFPEITSDHYSSCNGSAGVAIPSRTEESASPARPLASPGDSGPLAQQLGAVANVANEILSNSSDTLPQSLLERAVCIGIVPSSSNSNSATGGQPRGALVCRRGGNGPWGPPSMFTLTGAAVSSLYARGNVDLVLLVMNPEGANKMAKDRVKLGRGVSVAGGPVGARASVVRVIPASAEVLTYSRSGVFAGLSMYGATLRHDQEDNEMLYHRRVSAKQILLESDVVPPQAARTLRSTLQRYSPTGGEPF